MPAANKATVFLSGKVYWAKIIGDPRPNYGGDAREWTFEFEPDEKGLQKLIQQGLADRIKGKGYNIGTKGQHKDREPFIALKKSELSRDGNPNAPIRVYNEDDEAWGGDLIGNGSSANVKLDIRDYGPGKKKGVYPVAVRIMELIPYQSSEFGGMDEDEAPDLAPRKKAVKKDTFREDFGLEDDELPL